MANYKTSGRPQNKAGKDRLGKPYDEFKNMTPAAKKIILKRRAAKKSGKK
jgi:hypothetical protein|tara:strand:+ start:87 stop:236 length:150 start_codon:yes stop_codon:yes gene_type:complete